MELIFSYKYCYDGEIKDVIRQYVEVISWKIILFQRRQLKDCLCIIDIVKFYSLFIYLSFLQISQYDGIYGRLLIEK